MILKRLSDAVQDKDPVLGVICGTATNHSANAVSITHPHAPTQQLLFRKVLHDAGVEDPYDISYVEMHGTGTQAGDAVEMESVLGVFAPSDRRPRRQDQTLCLGAIKPNIGHGEAVSGISSLIKLLMMLQKDAIPANVGVKNLNRNFPTDLAERNVCIPRHLTKWSRGDKPRKVFLNNFSAAGGNTSMVVEEARSASNTVKRPDPRSWHFILCSGRSISSLKQNARNMISWISTANEANIASLAYTLAARRMHHEYRIAITASSLEEVQRLLESDIEKSHNPIDTNAKAVSFAFTGQGSQYTGIAKGLFETHSGFKANIQRLIRLAVLQRLPSFMALIDGSVDSKDLPPAIVQLGLACVQIALVHLWASWGIVPNAVLGHSLGEYAALYTAGVLSASDMILLVGRRAQLLEAKCTPYTHGMLAVKVPASKLYSCPSMDEHNIQIACINGPQETVLCGKVEGLVPFNEHLTTMGYRTRPLNVPFAFHSAQIEPILGELQDTASVLSFSAPKIPILSPLSGSVVLTGTDDAFDARYLVRHAREPVDVLSALESALRQDITSSKTTWLEIGGHPIVSGMIRSTIEGAMTVPSLRNDEDPWKTLSESCCALFRAGIAIDFQEVHEPFLDSLDLCDVPRYAFDNKNYWLDYHNDWTLTKGSAANGNDFQSTLADPVSSLSTTSCQRVLKQEVDAKLGTATIVVQSDVTESKLSRVLSGHKLNNTPLCPSSLYADMALTVAKHLYEELTAEKVNTVGFNICQMDVHTPFVAKDPPPEHGQHLQMEAALSLSSREVNLSFREILPNSQVRELGKGLVKIEDVNYWKQVWSRLQYLIQSQIDLLQEKAESGGAHKLLRGMAYKLFSALVEYGKPFRGMEEVTLHSTRPEATAKVRFQTTDEDGSFCCSPYWIDSLAHISGFTVNATDLVDASSIYVSHGWESIRLAKDLSSESEYRSYVRMLPHQEKDVMAGDVYVLEEGEIIAVVLGLKFKKVSRRAFDIMVPPNSGTKPPLLRSQTVAMVPPRPSLAGRIEESNIGIVSTSTASVSQSTIGAPTEILMSARVMDIVAEETDLDLSELVDGAAFDNLGVDSLMTLSISARLREELGLDVGSTLFLDCSTVGDLRKLIDESYSTISSTLATTEDESESRESMDSATTYNSEPDIDFMESKDLTTPTTFGQTRSVDNRRPIIPRSLTSGPKVNLAAYPSANSVLLQGTVKTAARRLFLLPDGSGSATSYVSIPPLDPSIVVYGLNCPFLKTPTDLTCSVEILTMIYMKEIQRRQPNGPYLIGGWSAGGVLAYETARQFIAAGEQIQQLFLLDSPCPIRLDPLPTRLHAFFDKIGLLGTGKPGSTPSWLLPHFAATVNVLSQYDPLPIPRAMCPSVVAIWCTDGVAPRPDDPQPPPSETGKEDPAPMIWLLKDRSDFGDNGWAQLLSREKMRFEVMRGHHFSMMKGDHVCLYGWNVKHC